MMRIALGGLLGGALGAILGTMLFVWLMPIDEAPSRPRTDLPLGLAGWAQNDRCQASAKMCLEQYLTCEPGASVQ